MRRTLAVLALAAGLLVVAACADGDDDGAFATLPPIRTTTTSSTTTTTISTDRRFHVVQRGETLSVIAAFYSVPIQMIIELNAIENPDNIPAGETIEIPSGVVIANQPTTTAAD